MTITSPAFREDQFIPSKFTCDGENINPRLDISGVPAAAKSLVLIVDDPDSPSGTWLHWSVWNIPPQTMVIREHSVPDHAVQGLTDFRTVGYGGPCPGQGTHRYQFTLYALDALLDLHTGGDKHKLKAMMDGHIVAQAKLVGVYKRNL